MQIRLPCVLMRGGTSRGPFFLAGHLPADPARRDALLLAAMGSPHPLQIDGIGGGNSLTSKTAIVGPSEEPGVDVEYLFAQVSVDRGTVDTRPNCGNMLAAVGPFAIEAGLVRARAPETLVRIRNRNTGALVEAVVQTPDAMLARPNRAFVRAARVDTDAADWRLTRGVRESLGASTAVRWLSEAAPTVERFAPARASGRA